MMTNKRILIKISISLLLVGVVVVNARIITDNIVQSNQIDEQIVSEANPRLNKKLIGQALETLESFATQELTTFSPSVTVEQESTNSEENEQISVAIQNASGINGAASEFAETLAQQGYEVSAISTAPSIQGETTVIYQTGLAEVAQQIENLLQGQNWPIGGSQEANSDQEFDVIIVLGR